MASAFSLCMWHHGTQANQRTPAPPCARRVIRAAPAVLVTETGTAGQVVAYSPCPRILCSLSANAHAVAGRDGRSAVNIDAANLTAAEGVSAAGPGGTRTAMR